MSHTPTAPSSRTNVSIAVLTDFPGSSIANVRVSDHGIQAELRREAVLPADGIYHDYNRHFCFGVRNESAAERNVDVSINGGTPSLSGKKPLLFTSGRLDRDFVSTPLVGATDHKQAYWFRLSIGGGATQYVANYMFRPPGVLEKQLDDLAVGGGAQRLVYGSTVEARDLVAYAYGRDDKPWILVTSGFHPTESDSLGCEAVMELLGSAQAGKLLDHYSMLVVPMVNPDGFYHGFNGCNANEVNLYWSFHAEEPRACPEAHHLWRLIEAHPPVLYIDFHAYTFQGPDKQAGPYLKPVALYRGPSVRRIVGKIDERLLEISGGHAMRGVVTYTPSTLPSKLTRRFNTITYAKYHLCLRDGVKANKERAVQVVVSAADILRSEAGDPGRVLRQRLGLYRWDPIRAASSSVLRMGVRLRAAYARIRQPAGSTA